MADAGASPQADVPPGDPYWWEEAPRPAHSEKAPPESADVAIVGSGYTGLSAALTLARAGRNVVVLDRLRAGEGASSRNGGICSGNLRLSLGKLIEAFGEDRGAAIYREGMTARQFLASLIERETIDCDYAVAGRFMGASQARHYEGLAREAELQRRIMGVETHAVPKSDIRGELGTDAFYGGVVREDIAGLHPGKYHLGLLAAAERAGATVITGVEVAGFDRRDNGFTVRTARGAIAARHVIGATNGYNTAWWAWLRRRIVPIPSQMIATAPISPNLMGQLMPKRRMCGDTNHLYNYFRPSPDGARILLGGRAGAGEADPIRRGRHLMANLTRMFPELEGIEVSHSWQGFTGFTFDFLPHVGEHDGVIYAAGYNGSGVVWATYLGHKAGLRVLGEPASATPFDEIGFRTRPLYTGRAWFLLPIYWWFGVQDRMGW